MSRDGGCPFLPFLLAALLVLFGAASPAAPQPAAVSAPACAPPPAILGSGDTPALLACAPPCAASGRDAISPVGDLRLGSGDTPALLACAPPPAILGSGDTPALLACAFRIVDLSASGDHTRFQEIIREQLELELGNAGYSLVPAGRWEAARDERGFTDRDLAEGTKAVAVADALGAQLAVTGFYRVEEGRIVLSLKAYDVVQRAFITGVLRTGTVDLSMYTLIDSAMARMLPEIRLLCAGPLPQDVQQVKEITLYSPDEEMEVYLAGEQFAGRIRQGALTLPYFPLAVGSTLRIEKRKAGYYTAGEDLAIGGPRVEASLKRLTRQTRRVTELSWTSRQLLGFGLAQRWYPVADILFLAAENYFYIQHDLTATGRAVLHDDLRFLVGGYPFSKVEARFRVGLSAGLGLVVTGFTVPRQPVFTDFYLNFLNAWAEWNWPRWMVYARSEGRYHLAVGRDLLGRGMIGNGPTLTLGVAYKW